MKIFILLALITSAAWAAPKTDVPDIIVDSKLDFNWSDMLVQKVRRLMVNYGYGDPFKSEIQSEITIVDATATELVSPGSRALVRDLGQMIGLELLNTRSKIKIKNFQYDIGSVTTDLKTSHRSSAGLIIDGDFATSNVRVVSDQITLSIEMAGARGAAIPVIDVVIKKPFLITQQNRDFVVSAAVQIIENKNDISFKVLRSDFQKMADLLALEPESVEIGFEDIIIPTISVRVGNRTVTIDPNKVRNFIVNRESQLKSLLVDQLRVQIRKGAADPLLKLVEEKKLPREYWMNSDIVASQFAIGKVSSSSFTKNLEITLPADFCTYSKFQSFNKNCLNLKETKTPPSVITDDKHRRSLDEIKDTLSTGDANLVASISEDYLNKMLAATIDAGLFNPMLDEIGASLGPKKVFVRLDERGESGTLYADVNYQIEGIQSSLIGRKEIRFPMVVKIAIRFEKKLGGLPVLLIRLEDANLSDNILRYGIPELELVSSVNSIPRFKGKVIKEIRKKTMAFVGKDIIALDYPEFKGLGLETVQFTSDGNGRLGAKLRLEELLRSED